MERVLKGTTAFATLDVDEAATAALVSATRGDGSVAFTDRAATIASGVARCTVPTDQLDLLSLVWTVETTETFETEVEIVGGFTVSTLALRRLDPLADEATYPDRLLEAARVAAEQALEDACHVAFTPRYGRAVLNGPGTTDLLLPQAETRRVRSLALGGTDTTYDDVVVDGDGGVLYRPSGWPAGRYAVAVEYEHGYTSAPGKVPDAVAKLVRYALVDSAVDDRAISVSNPDGNVQTFVQAGVRGAMFAIPEANAIVRQYGVREVG